MLVRPRGARLEPSPIGLAYFQKAAQKRVRRLLKTRRSQGPPADQFLSRYSRRAEPPSSTTRQRGSGLLCIRLDVCLSRARGRPPARQPPQSIGLTACCSQHQIKTKPSAIAQPSARADTPIDSRASSSVLLSQM